MYFFIKLGRNVKHGERMDPIDYGGQRSRLQWTRMEMSCDPNTDLSVVCFLIRLGRHVNHMVTPIDFGGHSSKVKVTMGIDKCGVRGDARLCVVMVPFLLKHNLEIEFGPGQFS